MVDDVEIKNVGGKYGVASEATLSALVDALTRGGGSGRAAKAEALARESNARSIKKETGERTLLGKASGATIEPMYRLAKEFIAGGTRMGDFTQAVFGAQSNITALVRSLDNTIDTFREMTSVGAGFNNSMYDFMKTSAITGMSMSEFSDFVIKNSEALKSLGGSVTEGTKRFADISKTMRNQFGKNLTHVGMSMSEMNDVLIQYTEFSIGRIGRETRSNRQLATGAAAYALEMDKLSKATGLSRKQLAQEQQKQLNDQRVRVAMTGMNQDQQLNLTNGLTFVGNYSSRFAESLKDMIDNVPDSKDTKGLYAASETFRNFAGDIENMSVEDIMKFTRTVGQEADEFAKANPFMDQLEDSIFSGVFQVGADVRSVSEMTDAQIKKMIEEQGKRDRLTDTLLDFDNAIRNLTTFIVDEIIKSPAFIALEELGVKLTTAFADLFGDASKSGTVASATTSFEKLTDSLIGKDGLITNGIKGLQTELTNFTDYIKTGGNPMDYFIERVGDLGTAMSNWFKEIFYGKEVAGRDRQGTEHQKGLLAKMSDGMITAFNSFWEGPLGTALADTIGGYFEKLVDGIILGINSATGGMFFGGAAADILTKQAEAGTVLTPEQTSVVAEQQYEDRTSTLGQLGNATVESGLALLDLTTNLTNSLLGLDGVLSKVDTAGAYEAWTRGTPDIPNQPSTQPSVQPQSEGVTLDPSAGFATGTSGFENFGKVTGTSLHGVEAVVPRNTMAGNMLAKSFDNDWNNPKTIPTQGSQENTGKYIIQLNSTMLMVLDELRKGNDYGKRTLNSVKGLGGDLNRGI